ncbi:MAG: SdrD B-like domain-containing protein, partial [Maricaulaceae bacterium]
YTFEYEICETLNPTNCETRSVSVTVDAVVIQAAAEATSNLNGSGGTTAHILTSDLMDGKGFDCVTSSNTTGQIHYGGHSGGLTTANGGSNSSSTSTKASCNDIVVTVTNSDAELTYNPSTGFISVAAGTPAGTYTLDYTICEVLNPSNCSAATETVNVTATALSASNDSATGVNGKAGNTKVLYVTANDTLGGTKVQIEDVTLSAATSVPSELTFDPSTGIVGVNPDTPAGVYTFDYEICEKLNPTNCETRSVSVTVDAVVIQAAAESFPSIDGSQGGETAHILTSDLMDGKRFDCTITKTKGFNTGQQAGSSYGGSSNTASCNDIVVTVTNSDAELTYNPSTGFISVAAGTPAGTYTLDYTICEILNPSNCSAVTETVNVTAAALSASNDTTSGVDGKTGNPSVINVIDNDTLDGKPVNVADVILTTPSGVPSELTFDPSTGVVGVNPNTPSGVYTFEYEICEKLNPTNCETRSVSVTVDAVVIQAAAEATSTLNGATGGTTAHILTSDLMGGKSFDCATSTSGGGHNPKDGSLSNGSNNGNTASCNDIVVTVTNSDAELTYNPSTGFISVAAGTPAGTYTLDYTICEVLNPSNCSAVTETVNVTAAALSASNDTVSGVDGKTGNPSVTNVIDNDTLNGQPVSIADVILTTPSGVPSELTFDPSTGVVGVNPNTPSGVYTFEYEICEKLNPTNCETRSVSVTVDAVAIQAVAETMPTINGSEGGTTASILASDTLNGTAIDPTDISVTIDAIAPELNYDPSTHEITVAPGTAQGVYKLTYTVCETLNPSNCETITETVNVGAANIVASAESFGALGGAGGGNVGSILSSDSLNGASINLADVTITVDGLDSALTYDATSGMLSLAAGTPAGSYAMSYTICENLNPTNCASVTETVRVNAANIFAAGEAFLPVNSVTGGTTQSILTADSLNGKAIDPLDVFIVIDSVDPEITYDPSTHEIIVPPGTAGGQYSLKYTVCEVLNGANCASITETVTVEMPAIAAMPESFPPVDGSKGGTTPSVLISDTIKGKTVSPSDVIITAGASDPSLTLDTETGEITVASNTPAGTYSLEYTICETDNPSNCSTGTETITVEAAEIIASAENFPPVSATSGGSTMSVLSSDTLGGVLVDPSKVTLTVVTSAQELVLDPVTSLITVAAGTDEGDYTVEYTVCENLNPNNCSAVTETVSVRKSVILAEAGDFPPIDSINGGTTPSIIATDTIDGVLVDPAKVTFTIDSVDEPLTVDPVTGVITVGPNTPAGEYTVTYTICETDKPENCSTGTEIVTVEAPVLVASTDSVSVPTSPEGTPSVINVLANDTLNDDPITPVAVVVTPAPGTTIPEGFTLHPDGSVDVGPDLAEGKYDITYQICDVVNPTNCETAVLTVTIDPPAASLSGIVYIDENNDNKHDTNEPLLAGWIVEIKDETGFIVETVRTDDKGFYESGNLPIGDYSVVFRNPETKAVYGAIENVNLKGGQNKIDQNLPIDPSGIVYDSITRAPIPGTVVTMTTAGGTPLPTACLVDPLQQNQSSDSMGFYRFDLVPGGAPECPLAQTTYNLTFNAPAGYKNGLSSIIGVEPGALTAPAGSGPYMIVPQSTAPAIGQETTYYLSFVLGTGSRDVIHNHIPLDSNTISYAPMSVAKVSSRTDVSFGDVVPYTITVTNTDDLPRENIDIVDYMPTGFKYVQGSARLNGAPATLIQNGRELFADDIDFAANETKTLNLAMVVGAGVGEGVYTNLAYTKDPAGQQVSSNGEAAVRVSSTPVFDCAELIGKVFDDANQNGYQDEGEKGLPGVRLATAKGLLITTDEHGRYHVTCAAIPNGQIGSNFIIKIDERTLPTGFRMVTENPRVVRMTRGKMSKANFGASIKRVVTLDLADAAFMPGQIELTPETAVNLEKLVAILRDQESTLRLNYHVQNAAMADTASDRLSAVTAHLENIWNVAGCCYALNIEQKMLKPNERNTQTKFSGE